MNEQRRMRATLMAGLVGLAAVACSVTPERVGEFPEDDTGADGAGAADGVPSGSTGVTSSGSGQQAEPASCDNIPPEFDPSTLPECPTSLCAGGARCVPSSLVLENGGPEQAAMLAPCDQPDTLCVPDDFIRTMGFFTPKTCRSVLGAEGRCLSTCIPQVAEQLEIATLPQDVCDEHQVCTPCFDPQTGDSTGACDQSCDEGPTEEPVLLPDCCGGLGSCVPTDSVPGDKLQSLGEYECGAEAGEGFICAPKVFVKDLNYKPKACSDIGFLAKLFLPKDKQDARCLPDCLPQLDDAPVKLKQGDCDEGFKCTPCYQPKFLGGVEPTGACDL